jgi:transcriptional regulator with XRE-family HTH domain
MGGRGSGGQPNHARRRQVARLRAEGLSLAEIGRRLGVTRVAVCRLLQRVARDRERPPGSFTCAGCGRETASEAARPVDSGAALCLPCLRQRRDAPFTARLRACRLAAGLTKGALARRAGLTLQAVVNYESGRHGPGDTSLKRLVRVLGPDLTAPGEAKAK